MLIATSFETPAGWLHLEFDEHYIYHSRFTKHPIISSETNKLSSFIASELNAYFHDCHHRFQLPLKPQGTLYQQRVWNALLVIPVGRTITYGDLAKSLQTSPRAIGQACKSNPLALFIPCHRVVGKMTYGGYMGQIEALDYKIRLLDHEDYQLNLAQS
ncbi:Methylated DNA-protein cysteine methyltransferase [Legionella beliardensis]|uniref:Methylated DNA-protein cysteine methyltransferase n=1 Tax=Legionella beliardensis TaxID=91822 RepID=A0A378HZL3_9GAMM|nr:methylated-DNA--[protein]-cysteine S-methyltransferase [Legionella beliardensis]STX27825.1 Methylated DNA-protein cysteine methyltransferase [Legionella beliardensis]